MSLPQLIGLKCVRCGKSISSIVEATFCEECGNPVHRNCLSKTEQPLAERCPTCGGDPKDSLAQEIRRERGTEQQARARAQAERTGASAALPVSSVCPKCSNTEFTRVRPEGWVSFAHDRVCNSCGTRYTPPTPIWAALIFLAAGLLLAGFGGVSVFVRAASENPLQVPAGLCEAFLGVLGVLAIIQGIRSLARPGKV